MIDRLGDVIASYCYPGNTVSLGLVEGLNNKTRILQRRAYGYRDEDYTYTQNRLGLPDSVNAEWRKRPTLTRGDPIFLSENEYGLMRTTGGVKNPFAARGGPASWRN